MGKSIKVNYFYSLMYETLAIIIPFVTIPYISRVLGAKAIGDYNYIYGIVTYFGLVALNGTGQYSQREIAVVQKNKEMRSVIFWEIFWFRLLSTAIVSLFYFVYICFFLETYTTLLLIHFLTVISWAVDISWYFQGIENFKITSIRNSIVKICGTILIFICVKEKDDIIIYTIITCATTLLGNMTMWMYIFKEVKIVKISKLKIVHHIRGILEFFIPVVAIQLYTVLDKTMLGSLCNTTQVGYYSQAENMIKIALTCVSSLFTVLLPRLSIVYRAGQIKQLDDYYRKSVDFTFFLGLPMAVGCILISDLFVPLFLGEGFNPVSTLLKIESPLFIILGCGRLFGNFLVSMNRQNKYTISVISAAIVNIILNLAMLMIFKTGAYGVAVASVVAEMVSTGFQMFFAKDILNIKYLFRALRKYIIPSMVMLVVVIGVQLIFTGTIALLFSLFFAICTYFGVLFVCKDEQILFLLDKLK